MLQSELDYYMLTPPVQQTTTTVCMNWWHASLCHWRVLFLVQMSSHHTQPTMLVIRLGSDSVDVSMDCPQHIRDAMVQRLQSRGYTLQTEWKVVEWTGKTQTFRCIWKGSPAHELVFHETVAVTMLEQGYMLRASKGDPHPQVTFLYFSFYWRFGRSIIRQWCVESVYSEVDTNQLVLQQVLQHFHVYEHIHCETNNYIIYKLIIQHSVMIQNIDCFGVVCYLTNQSAWWSPKLFVLFLFHILTSAAMMRAHNITEFSTKYTHTAPTSKWDAWPEDTDGMVAYVNKTTAVAAHSITFSRSVPNGCM